ncbi:tetratricopeptide repeat protein [Marinobacter sp. M216]|uniref:Tetratricopeptide repeat protein n=1 Tax=Marinobacter albus TaxID=3030833 RepID=A0ABT7HHR8_9GAMM|nr:MULTISPECIES: tetratricopeptide repeat protein [unclassified Marinobacter]MBW7472495.1 sel1 repeat family protein [Marinobacter sp. F4218]MDK9559045.1 tetratricopeptide repeat protein [Marinobacter sp. M216]
MGPRSTIHKAMWLTAVLTLLSGPTPTQAFEDDQKRTARDIVKVLEAYAVYKMGQYDLAFERYLTLAKRGNRQGMLNVANMYSEGMGVEQSDAKAFRWYRRLAESGDRIGMEETARAYRTGVGVTRDEDRAIYWEHLANTGRNQSNRPDRN